MSYVIFFGTMFLMLLIGVPICIALAGSMVCLLLVDPVTSMTFVTQAMYTSGTPVLHDCRKYHGYGRYLQTTD